MIPRFNLHTHTPYCDGKNTIEQLIDRAIGLGCSGIGFSGHSYLDIYENKWSMTPEQTESYIREINEAKARYRDRIEILLGIEYDSFSNFDTAPYDYVIGSVHHVKCYDGYICVDMRPAGLIENVNKHLGGNIYKFCEEYYKELSGIIEKTHCDIIGHFDIVTKHNEDDSFFDTNDRRYRNAAFECLDHLIESDPVFEINTGAIARGLRKTPYPSVPIMKRIVEKGGRLTVTTDCHNADLLLCHYDESIEYARSCGVKELYFMKNGKFEAYKI